MGRKALAEGSKFQTFERWEGNGNIRTASPLAGGYQCSKKEDDSFRCLVSNLR